MNTDSQKSFVRMKKDDAVQCFSATLSLSLMAESLEQAQEILGMFIIDNNLEEDCEVLSINLNHKQNEKATNHDSVMPSAKGNGNP